MGSFDKYSNYDENTGFSSIVFGSDKPVLEVELNEMQQILNTKISRLIKVLGNCVTPLSDGNINFNKDTQELTLTDCVVLEKSGFTFYVKSATTTLDSENKYAYFKVEEVDLDSKSSMREYGNELGDLIPNPIKDSRSPAETSRRKAISYSLLSGSSVPENTDTLLYIPIGVLSDGEFSLLSVDKFVEVSNKIENVGNEIKNHTTAMIYSEKGVHGFRYFNNELQVQDKEGNWVNAKPKELISTLNKGSTSLTFTDESITSSSTIDVYASVYDVSPKNASISENTLTLTFKAQTTNVDVKVVIS